MNLLTGHHSNNLGRVLKLFCDLLELLNDIDPWIRDRITGMRPRCVDNYISQVSEVQEKFSGRADQQLARTYSLCKGHVFAI